MLAAAANRNFTFVDKDIKFYPYILKHSLCDDRVFRNGTMRQEQGHFSFELPKPGNRARRVRHRIDHLLGRRMYSSNQLSLFHGSLMSFAFSLTFVKCHQEFSSVRLIDDTHIVCERVPRLEIEPGTISE